MSSTAGFDLIWYKAQCSSLEANRRFGDESRTMILRYLCWLSTYCTSLYPTKQNSSYQPLWETEHYISVTNLDTIHKLLRKLRTKANESKVGPCHIHHTKRNLPASIKNVQLTQQEDVKYLGLHLDRRLTWRKHIFTKGSNWEWRSPKCIGYLDGSQNSPQTIQFSYTKQYSNQSGTMEYNCGVWLPLQT
jgi:hypothetical protein